MVKKIKAGSIIALILLCLLILKQIIAQDINSIDGFQAMMDRYGVWGPIVLTFFQAFQVVVPILPGYLGCAVGAMVYGPAVGFLCNYIGISAGSIIAFFLAERFGPDLVMDMFSEKTYNKWKQKLEGKKSYELFLFISTLLPLFPDDFVCYFSGIIKMDRKRFIWIIILGKPWCILGYSLLFGLFY